MRVSYLLFLSIVVTLHPLRFYQFDSQLVNIIARPEHERNYYELDVSLNLTPRRTCPIGFPNRPWQNNLPFDCGGFYSNLW